MINTHVIIVQHTHIYTYILSHDTSPLCNLCLLKKEQMSTPLIMMRQTHINNLRTNTNNKVAHALANALLVHPTTRYFTLISTCCFQNHTLNPNLDPHECLEKFLGIIGWDPIVCKSNRLHVDILQFSLLNWGIFYKFLQNDRQFSCSFEIQPVIFQSQPTDL